jgi:decaprenylphospho-beta-D-ribofuranose 2-oxidase
MRRSYGDAALNNGGRVIDMTRLDRMLGFDPATGILEVEAGARIGEIAAAFAPRAGCPGHAWHRICHGRRLHRARCPRQEPPPCRLLLPACRLTLLRAATGEVEKPLDTDLFRATAGGLGQTGNPFGQTPADPARAT